MIVLTTNATANPTVHRFRLRSTSEPPPNGPAPVPTPKAPESPASVPGGLASVTGAAPFSWRV